MNNLKLAWRNLWRNKKRTLITISSIFFGVIFAILMNSMRVGSLSNMIDNIVHCYSGYIQIHAQNYWEDKTINNSFTITDSLTQKISNIKEISKTTSRLEYFALSSSKDKTKGSFIVGVDPENEDKITNLSKWICSGSYLKNNDKGILIGINLAKYLNVSVNDTLVLIGQGYHGISAAGKYKIKGIFKFPSPEFNKQMIFMDINNCRDLFSADNLITSVVIMVNDYSNVSSAMEKLHNSVSKKYEVLSWEDMQPELVQLIEGKKAGGNIIILILFMIIAFGILGTVIMMAAERKKELAVMIAIGMQKIKLFKILFLETLLIGIIGVISGVIFCLPVIAYYWYHPPYLTGEMAQTMIDMGFEPVMKFSWSLQVFSSPVIIIFLCVLIISLYPVYYIYKLKVINALRA